MSGPISWLKLIAELTAYPWMLCGNRICLASNESKLYSIVLRLPNYFGGHCSSWQWICICLPTPKKTPLSITIFLSFFSELNSQTISLHIAIHVPSIKLDDSGFSLHSFFLCPDPCRPPLFPGGEGGIFPGAPEGEQYFFMSCHSVIDLVMRYLADSVQS